MIRLKLITIFIFVACINSFGQSNIYLERSLPVGTVITSLLNPVEFYDVVDQDPEVIDIGHLYFVPSDGRNVEGSLYTSVTGRGRVPDLRGMFIRGLNSFDEGNSRSDGFQDPEPNRSVGTLQKDTLKSHSHPGKVVQEVRSNWDGGPPRNTPVISTVESIGAYGGSETRPVNVSVYYYIKIN